jgi:hypothetical protein
MPDPPELSSYAGVRGENRKAVMDRIKTVRDLLIDFMARQSRRASGMGAEYWNWGGRDNGRK